MESRVDDVLIVGAGLSGLTAAKILKAAGKTIKIIEAGDSVGGRVQTDEVNGFLLDRGFQVFLKAYPEAKQLLDYKALDFKAFKPGAIIFDENGTTEIGDPFREPLTLFKTIFSPVGSLPDKFKMLSLKLKLMGTSVESIFEKPETTTVDHLVDMGFSDKMIQKFFVPFMTGIFLEDKLYTSSRMFDFVFKMFSEGDTVVPAKGMGMISKQLAAGLLTDELFLNEKVKLIENNTIISSKGYEYKAKSILIATAADGFPMPLQKPDINYKSVTTVYFTAEKLPFARAIIALNASAKKLVNNVAFMEQVSASYAPVGFSLIAVSLAGDHTAGSNEVLAEAILMELKQWFPGCGDWRFLKLYHIPYALPKDERVQNDVAMTSIKIAENIYVCGDYLLNGSINAAMKSGRLAAEAILSLN